VVTGGAIEPHYAAPGAGDLGELASVPSDRPAPFADQLRLAVAVCLARFKGSSREHTESDLRCYLFWCAERGLDPLAARRPHLELYIRWMQELRRFKPSTVSRRFSVAAGFYRTCVIDGLREHSPTEHVRRPAAQNGQFWRPPLRGSGSVPSAVVSGPSTVTWSICDPPCPGRCWLASARAVQRNVRGPAYLPRRRCPDLHRQATGKVSDVTER
jgi:hypothetical protein